ncbi:hypothetical protein C8J56DRAFT_1119898 [Mycena floridula]|nr:hypothetical protein C8J56DRAFT_1119898 [Mycena floridula]
MPYMLPLLDPTFECSHGLQCSSNDYPSGGPRKRKEQEGEGEPKEAKKGGRPRKISSESEVNSPPKKRGRPSKVKVEPKTEVVPKKPTLSVKVAKAKKPAIPSKRATKARPALKLTALGTWNFPMCLISREKRIIHISLLFDILDKLRRLHLVRWQSKIIQTLKEAEGASKKVLKMSKKPLTAPKSTSALAAPPTIVTTGPERSIAELIELQGPSIAQTQKKRKWKDEQDAEETAGRDRRSQFHWNKDYDELVRDASAIIKARCRDAKRLDWGAFEQIFPSVLRDSVRQRLGSNGGNGGRRKTEFMIDDGMYLIAMSASVLVLEFELENIKYIPDLGGRFWTWGHTKPFVSRCTTAPSNGTALSQQNPRNPDLQQRQSLVLGLDHLCPKATHESTEALRPEALRHTYDRYLSSMVNAYIPGPKFGILRANESVLIMVLPIALLKGRESWRSFGKALHWVGLASHFRAGLEADMGRSDKTIFCGDINNKTIILVNADATEKVKCIRETDADQQSLESIAEVCGPMDVDDDDDIVMGDTTKDHIW